MRLHLGCGSNVIPGWRNLDLEPVAGAERWDMRWGLPADPGTVDLIYTEHMIEHLTREDGLRLLQTCQKALRPGGVIRISTPDLTTLLAAYQRRDIGHYARVGWEPLTPAQMVNEGMRSWGHRYLYDYEDLSLLLVQAGFHGIEPCFWGISCREALSGLETRPDLGDLIVEAARPGE